MKSLFALCVFTVHLWSSSGKFSAGWSAFFATSKTFCKFYPLILDGECSGTGDLALRAITLGSTSDWDCGSKINANQLISSLTLRQQCCRYREGDVTYTVHLPPLKENALPSPYDELVKKCFSRPTRCDLDGVNGTFKGQVKDGTIPGETDPLSYVIPTYSCIPKNSTISFAENRTLTAPVISLRQEKKIAPSSKCVIYSRDCYVTISLGVINVVVRDHCVLTLEDEGHRAVTLNCTDARMYETWKGPVRTSSSNFLNVSLDFQPGTNASKQIVWLEATGSTDGKITAVCGASVDTLDKTCVTTTTPLVTTTPSTTTPTTTTNSTKTNATPTDTTTTPGITITATTTTPAITIPVITTPATIMLITTITFITATITTSSPHVATTASASDSINEENSTKIAATAPSSSSCSNVGAIVGGVMGGVAFALGFGILAYVLYKKKNRVVPEVSEQPRDTTSADMQAKNQHDTATATSLEGPPIPRPGFLPPLGTSVP